MQRLQGLFGNPGGLHQEAAAAKKELEAARKRAAKVLGAHADEIIFTSGGTESNNLAIFGVLRSLLHEHGELNAITTPIEHASVLEPLRALEREGLYLTYLSVDSEGVVEPKALHEALNEQTAFVSVQMVNSEVGTVQNIREIAKEIRHVQRSRYSADESTGSLSRGTKERGSGVATSSLPLYFHTDASQAPLWLPLNVEKLGVDLLTLDAQKMMGPKSSGLLYARRGTKLEPVLFGGGQERGFRSGTENVVLAGALAQALTDAQKNVETRAKQVSAVRDQLWTMIKSAIPDALVYGPSGYTRVANNVCISVPGLNGQMAVVALNTHGVAASTRSACSTADEESSHVLVALGASEAAAQEAVRLTLLPDVTKREVRRIVRTLYEVANRYRNVVY
jgi:cysteine desulfurase